jgi:ATP-dependent Clp protease ATP-binding subunit ClpC
VDWAGIWFSIQLTCRRFSDRATKAVSLGRRHARREGHRFVTPEHLLLGLAEVEPGVSGAVLKRLGVDLAADRPALLALLETVPRRAADEPVVLSPEAERVLRQATVQARELGHNYIGTEHLLLGLLAVGPGPAADYLAGRGVTLDAARAAVRRVLGE